MRKLLVATATCALLAACNQTEASAPPTVSPQVEQWARVVLTTSQEAQGDVVYMTDGNVRRVDNVSEFHSSLAAMDARNELHLIDRIVERAPTAEYATAVIDSYAGRTDQQ